MKFNYKNIQEKYMKTRILILTIASICMLLLTHTAQAATINVNTLTDELNTDGDCSLREAIISANHNQNERVLVFGHLSHVYPTGASIYITYIFRRSYDPDENIHRWHEMKSAASKAIINHGGTISHQHGVGRDHARYLENEKGKIGINLLSKIGQFFDPEDLLNRGVMIEDQSNN